MNSKRHSGSLGNYGNSFAAFPANGFVLPQSVRRSPEFRWGGRPREPRSPGFGNDSPESENRRPVFKSHSPGFETVSPVLANGSPALAVVPPIFRTAPPDWRAAPPDFSGSPRILIASPVLGKPSPGLFWHHATFANCFPTAICATFSKN